MSCRSVATFLTMKSRSLMFGLLLSLGGLVVTTAAAGEWKPLFDGETLGGWTQRNGAAVYTVSGGAIVGKTTEGSPNSFLCSDAEYGDFELEFDVLVDCGLNSGVQIRSQTRGGPTGRVNGPQVEIECSGENGAEAGYIYGEAAGGWMTPEEARQPHQHFVDGQWNHYRVRAIGANIKVWINGALISDLTHAERYASHPRGFVGLQVHGIRSGTGPYEVRWRNIRIREFDDAWQALFNGKDLEGWTTKGNWSVPEPGVVMIEPREGEFGWERYDAYLWSERTFSDFVLEVDYLYPEGGNSGVYFRVEDRDSPVDHGIEAQILDSSKLEREMTAHDHGGIIRTAAPTKNMSMQPGEWNHMVVTCEGRWVSVDLNGERIVHVDTEGTPVGDRPLEGYIGLQDHGRPNDLKFRNIRILELP